MEQEYLISIFFSYYAECVPDNIFLVDMGKELIPLLWLKLICIYGYIIVKFMFKWPIPLFVVFIQIEVLLSFKFQACNCKSSFGVRSLSIVLALHNVTLKLNSKYVFSSVVHNYLYSSSLHYGVLSDNKVKPID